MKESKITTTCKKKQKGLQGLDLINAFLFRASTEKIKDAEFIAKLIIERATGHKVGKISVVSEKPLTGIDVGRHGICMDLYVEEYEGERRARVYDIEPNNYGMEELPLRSRYSQALTDVKLLESGESYGELPNYISIWILPYDPFGQKRMLYTVKNFVAEDTQIVYNDGAMKLFLYTGGELGGNGKLKDMLHYFINSDKEHAVDPELSQLHSIVEHARENRKVGEEYMTLQDYLDCEIKQGIKKGIEEELAKVMEEAKAETIAEVIEMMKELNIPDEQIEEKIMEKYRLSKEEAKSYLN